METFFNLAKKKCRKNPIEVLQVFNYRIFFQSVSLQSIKTVGSNINYNVSNPLNFVQGPRKKPKLTETMLDMDCKLANLQVIYISIQS